MCGVLGVPPQEIKRIPFCDNTAVALLYVSNGEITVEYQSDNAHIDRGASARLRTRNVA
jgi:hypothetical protein